MSKLTDMQTPVFWAEEHPGPLSAEDWKVEIGGLVEKPVTLTYQEILALPKSVADARKKLKQLKERQSRRRE